MSEKEIDEALDALEEEQEEIQEEITEEVVEEPAKKPPGFIGYEDWVASGKDPADFRGENAYTAQYESLKEVRELKDTMTHVVDGMEVWKQQQNEQKAQEIEQAKVLAKAEFEKAREDEDMTAALAAQEKLNNLNQQSVPLQINPVITDFSRNNPILDPNSAQYDAEFHDDVRMMHNSNLDKLTGGDRSKQLSTGQIERSLALALKQAKEFRPEKFVSPRNTRTSAPKSKQRPAPPKGNSRTTLKGVGANSRNTNDANPAQDMYDYLKEIDPDGSSAETFAKNVIGE